MITIGQGSARLCSGVTRRDFLRAGGIGLGSLGLSLGELNALGADRSDRADRAVILLMLVGGPSQLETWDPKPDAPEEIRGRSARSRPGPRHPDQRAPAPARRADGPSSP